MTVEPTQPTVVQQPPVSPWWNPFAWLFQGNAQQIPSTPEAMQQQLLMQQSFFNLFQGQPTQQSMITQPGTPGTFQFTFLNFLLKILPFLSFLQNMFPPVSQPQTPAEPKRFLELDGDNSLKIEGGSGDDRVVLKRDIQTGAYLVLVNDERFDIRPEDLSRARNFSSKVTAATMSSISPKAAPISVNCSSSAAKVKTRSGAATAATSFPAAKAPTGSSETPVTTSYTFAMARMKRRSTAAPARIRFWGTNPARASK